MNHYSECLIEFTDNTDSQKPEETPKSKHSPCKNNVSKTIEVISNEEANVQHQNLMEKTTTSGNKHQGKSTIAKENILTLPMLKLLSTKALGCKRFLKTI